MFNPYHPNPTPKQLVSKKIIFTMSFINSVIQPLSNLGHFWQQKANSRILRWNLFFIAIQIGLLAWKFTQLPSQIPLYYSLPWGDSQLANASYLFLLSLKNY